MTYRAIFQLLTALMMTMTLAVAAWAAYPVNINKANAAQLAEALDGVGEVKAGAIVAYREANGPFTSVDQLTDVKGFGDKMLEKNREYLLLE